MKPASGRARIRSSFSRGEARAVAMAVCLVSFLFRQRGQTRQLRPRPAGASHASQTKKRLTELTKPLLGPGYRRCLPHVIDILLAPLSDRHKQVGWCVGDCARPNGKLAAFVTF